MWKLSVFCIHHLPPSLEGVCCLIKMWITAPKTSHLTLCEVLVRFLLLSAALSICCFGCYGNEWSRMCVEFVLHVQSPWSVLRSDAAFQFSHDYPIDFFLAWHVSTFFQKPISLTSCRSQYIALLLLSQLQCQSSNVSTWLGSSRGSSIPACSASKRLTASVAVAGSWGGSETREGGSVASCGSPELRRERESGSDGLRGAWDEEQQGRSRAKALLKSLMNIGYIIGFMVLLQYPNQVIASKKEGGTHSHTAWMYRRKGSQSQYIM